MTHSVIIPVLNELHETKGIVNLLKTMTTEDVEFVFIDNGSTDKWEDFVLKYIKPKKVNFIKNERNIGLVKTMQQGFESCSSDIITFIHNDVFIYDNEWNREVEQIFESEPSIGIIGAFGSGGVFPNGGRAQVGTELGKPPGFSNMLESEIHGSRLNKGERAYVSIFDGFFMSFRREMLVKAGGFDQRYQWHHFYDRDISLESLRHGYKNIVMPLNCHHVCGRTANQPTYQDQVRSEYGAGKYDHTQIYSGDKATHDDNMHRFQEKWGDSLPVHVDKNTGEFIDIYPFRGSQIVGYQL